MAGRAERRRPAAGRRAPDRAPLRRLPGLDRRQPLSRPARNARPAPLRRLAARRRRRAGGRAHRSRLRHLRQRGGVRRQRQLDRRLRRDARAAALHDARVPLPARRPPLEDDRARRHPDGGVPRQRADLLPGDRRFLDRHGPVAGAPAASRGAGHIDIIGDIVESANMVIRRPRTASIVLGGGTPKNFINQASVQAEFYSAGGRRPPLRAADRHRRAAFRRRLGLEPRRGAELGQAGDRLGAGRRSRPTRRSRCRCWSARSRRRRRRCWPRRKPPVFTLAVARHDDRRPDRSQRPLRGSE